MLSPDLPNFEPKQMLVKIHTTLLQSTQHQTHLIIDHKSMQDRFKNKNRTHLQEDEPGMSKEDEWRARTLAKR